MSSRVVGHKAMKDPYSKTKGHVHGRVASPNVIEGKKRRMRITVRDKHIVTTYTRNAVKSSRSKYVGRKVSRK